MALALLIVGGCAGSARPAARAGGATAPGTAGARTDTTAAALGVSPRHSNDLADFSLAGPYPRFTPAELAASGYPDHLHAFAWPGWQPLRDAHGQPYGPHSLCEGGQPRSRPDLAVGPDTIAFGPFRLRHQAYNEPCDIIIALEMCDLGRVRCRELLGVERRGELVISSPETFDAWRQRSGYGAWRLYQLRGDSCLIQPVATLLARTLLGHAMVEMCVEWTLAGATGNRLPPWLSQGLAGYLADSGVHLNNFMAPFRLEGPVLLHPAQVDSLLAAAPDADPARDQQLFRRARYSAFLMAWRLVEDNGGFEPLRRLLARVAAGGDFAAACRKAYGVDPAELAARLDPVSAGEPIGAAVQPRQPSRPPGAGG